ncbi:MAG: DUF1501 domain-containing protein [Planctomycetes bacterium]|nr:DUF1501 domain-containing protein [Planctomycetota bacterium]
MLQLAACGFGAAAFSALAHARSAREESAARSDGRHHAPKARSCIFLYMDGGPGQMDTFDPKPELARWNGQPFPARMEATQFNNNGTTLASPWEFARHGNSGLEVSALFPRLATQADRLCVVRSMTSPFNEHTNANYFLHTGVGLAGRPSMGAWVRHGLGDMSSNLPGFVVIDGGLIPPGGLECFGSGFLPARNQATLLKPRGPGVSFVEPLVAAERQRRMLELARAHDRALLARSASDAAVAAAIDNAEQAFRMQAGVPELVRLDDEPESVRRTYGCEDEYEPTRTYARQCLLARRLVERGVPFIELSMVPVGQDRWDQHADLEVGHRDNARAVDRPIAALLEDLHQRGLLDATLVVFAGEFGRTPFAQGSNGRDHNPHGFSVWLAGGGVKGGHVHGATDEFGYKVVDGKCELHDLHATMLHLMGWDHRRLTLRFGGRDMRLTDVHGRVVRDWLA